MSKFIELKDLYHFNGKFIYDNFIFRNLKRIEFLSDLSNELTFLDISKQNIKDKVFIINRTNCEIILKGNKNYDFEIIDSGKNENWKFHNPIKHIGFSNKSFYKSKNSEVKLISNGFGNMVYSNNNFVGRIRRKKIDIKDENYINILIGICCVDIISNDIYKLNETND
ncbi:hypothetical protein [Psychroserpens luteus]|uniref:Uncharacterized protein n=1 Tax=Psychroserpens luteus TaxID=1434066 RepID=A0ABW5ZQD3_9FLAO|nr:hypothetical protein [Psychroserpens luteus]